MPSITFTDFCMILALVSLSVATFGLSVIILTTDRVAKPTKPRQQNRESSTKPGFWTYTEVTTYGQPDAEQILKTSQEVVDKVILLSTQGKTEEVVAELKKYSELLKKGKS